MKNREKYPNTDEAMKAWRKHKDETGCPCSFGDWLDNDPADFPLNGIASAFIAMSLAAHLDKELQESATTTERKPTERKPESHEGVECPICHGKNGKVEAGLFYPFFACPDCGSYVGVDDDYRKKHPSILSSCECFKSYIADLCKKNSKKD